MSNWKLYKFSDFVDINPKVTLKKGVEYSYVEMKDLSEGNKFVLPSQKREITGGSRFENGDTLFARITPCLENGKICQVKGLNNGVGFGSTEFLVFRGKAGISDTNFVHYLSLSEEVRKFAEQNMVGTSGRQRVSWQAFENLELSLPDLPTQTAIAEILSSLDDKIELNNKINQELENLAQTLFKQWFIDFEFPIRLNHDFQDEQMNKMIEPKSSKSSNPANQASDTYRSSGGEMVDSELGEIPKGWKVKSLDEIADYLNGLALQKFPTKNDKDFFHVIKIRELRQGITNSTDKANIEIPEKYIIQNGDVLFAWSGSLMIDLWTNGEGALNQHLFKVTSGQYPKWFYFYWTKHHLDEFIKIAESKATTMGHIQRKHLTEAKVVVPNLEKLSQFNDSFENIVDKIISNRIENQELTNLRDTLLSKLITGELAINSLNLDLQD
jgi:type I restriction enzyme S subunit